MWMSQFLQLLSEKFGDDYSQRSGQEPALSEAVDATLLASKRNSIFKI